MGDTFSANCPSGAFARIRMYRLGIGDCFLLTFVGGGSPRHVLIDCGVLQGTANGKQKIERVAESIRDETGGHLDVMVATHEHWDHVSGFQQAGDIFDALRVDRIWVAWTEDTNDPVAQRFKEEKRMRLQAVHMALNQLARIRSPEAEDYGSAIAQLLGFYGGPAEGASLAAFSENTGFAMKAVTERKNGPSPTFCKPGDVLKPEWGGGLRVYVLGPPRDPAALRDLRGKAGTDIYKIAGIDSLYLAALTQTAGEEPDDKSFPFHPSLRWLSEHTDKILKNDALAHLYKSYNDEDAAWRRIDNEWLVSSARMALQLDSATNNTSLVLAFELDDERVLLFPADAQIGSWRSWLGLQWSAEQAGRSAAVTARDLLQRTVFYKVGHHGSENATRKEDGLEFDDRWPPGRGYSGRSDLCQRYEEVADAGGSPAASAHGADERPHIARRRGMAAAGRPTAGPGTGR